MFAVIASLASLRLSLFRALHYYYYFNEYVPLVSRTALDRLDSGFFLWKNLPAVCFVSSHPHTHHHPSS
jgi:hypothetical protein